MKGKKKISVRSIAEAVGVSIPVVSNTLNNRQSTIQTSDKVKQAILDEAIKNNYRLNSNVGVVLPKNVISASAYLHTFLCGVFEQANQFGYGVFSSELHSSKNHEIPWFLDERKVSAAIFLHELPENIVDFCKKERIPWVLANPMEKPLANDCVLIDDYGIFRDLLENLRKESYTKYYYINYLPDKLNLKERYRALEDFAADNSDCEIKNFYIKGPWSKTLKMYEEVREEIGKAGDDSVFITDSQGESIMLLEACSYHRKRFPEDLGLVCNPLISSYNRDITCYNMPIFELGKSGVRMIEEKWRTSHAPVENIVLSGDIKMGRSTKRINT